MLPFGWPACGIIHHKKRGRLLLYQNSYSYNPNKSNSRQAGEKPHVRQFLKWWNYLRKFLLLPVPALPDHVEKVAAMRGFLFL